VHTAYLFSSSYFIQFFLPSQQVHKSCGQPSIRLNEKLPTTAQRYDGDDDDDENNDKGPSLEKKQIHHNGGSNSGSNKWSPPPDTEMLQFLSVLDRSKSLSLQIANR
jgi:hypothetical protein